MSRAFNNIIDTEERMQIELWSKTNEKIWNIDKKIEELKNIPSEIKDMLKVMLKEIVNGISDNDKRYEQNFEILKKRDDKNSSQI
jgi:hypothetical protein